MVLASVLISRSPLPAEAAVKRPHPRRTFVDGYVLVKLREGVSKPAKENAFRARGMNKRGELSGTGWMVLELPPGLSVAQALADAKLDPDVLEVQPNFVSEPLSHIINPVNDPFVPNVNGKGQNTYLPGLGAYTAWGTAGVNTNKVTIAVIDSGVMAASTDRPGSADHPDLAGRFPAGPAPDFTVSFDQVTGAAVTYLGDTCNHGTAVASIAAATHDNAIGMVGASSNSIQVMALGVFDTTFINGECVNGASDVAVSSAIRYAADAKVNFPGAVGQMVINLSLGHCYASPGAPPPLQTNGPCFQSPILVDAVNYALDRGVPVVAAAGNYTFDGCYDPGPEVNVATNAARAVNTPASIPGVITVGSVSGGSSCFSARGPEMDVMAPGEGIVVASTRPINPNLIPPTGTTIDAFHCGEIDPSAGTILTSTNSFCVNRLGTSMAAPFVSGLAALILSKYTPWTTPANSTSQVHGAIVLTANDLSGVDPGWQCFSSTTGWGTINMGSAVTFLGSGGSAVSPLAPAPTGLTGTTLGVSSIQWNWSSPGCRFDFDFYQVVRSSDGVQLLDTPTSTYMQTGLAPNSQQTLQVRAREAMFFFNAPGPLSAPFSQYTLAESPASLDIVPLSVTTTSVALQWSPNGNPVYTRYELQRSADINFGSTIIQMPFSSYTTLSPSFTVANLAPATTYYFRVRAIHKQFGDDPFLFTGILTAYSNTRTVLTRPVPPLSLSGTAASASSIQWSWTLSPTAGSYNVYTAQDVLLDNVPGPPYTQTFTQPGAVPLGPNSPYGVRVQAISPSGTSELGPAATAYTLANPPVSATVTSVSSATVSLSWLPNSNPGYTTYQASLSTNSTFAGLTSSRSAVGTSLTFTELLPGTTYYVRAWAMNVDFKVTSTNPSSPPYLAAVTAGAPSVSQSQAPASPYTLAAQVAAQWHFDEGTGFSSADASGQGQTAVLTCSGSPCTAPQWTDGRPGLGGAVSFSGMTNSYASATVSGLDGYNGPLTVEAWVYPNEPSQNQKPGAGIAAKGEAGNLAFALYTDFGNYIFRFNLDPATYTVISNSFLQTGAWTHLAGVYDGSSLRIYVNGALDGTTGGVGGSRATNPRAVALGSRQSGSSAFDLAFSGRIDEVRIFTKALSAVEVSSAFASAQPPPMALPPPNDGVLLQIPPDAFKGQATLFVSSSPQSSPIRSDPAKLSQGLGSPPEGRSLAEGSLVELVGAVGGIPYTGGFGSSVTVHLPYPDINGDGLVDGLSPPTPALQLKMFTLDETLVRWVALEGNTVDTANRRVSGKTGHFSIFALFGASQVGPTLLDARVYPVPWRAGSGGPFDSGTCPECGGRSGLVFDKLPLSGALKIFTLAGDFVREVGFEQADNGTIVWDGTNRAGRLVASGVYFAVVQGSDGGRKVLRFAIER